MQISVGTLLSEAKETLKFLGVEEAEASADFLLADLLDCSRSELYLRAEEKITADLTDSYRAMIDRRKSREPVAYILGKAHFWNEELIVNQHCLIPRSETELIVEKFIEKLEVKRQDSLRILDLCSGSGAIGIALLREFSNATVAFLDISSEALEIVRENIKRYKLTSRAELIQNDLLDGLNNGSWDVIVSNPPYLSHQDWREVEPELKYEPEIAFSGGEDGLSCYRRILASAAGHLLPGGYLFLELGAGQSRVVSADAEKSGFHSIEIVKDFQNIERVLIARV